MKMVGNVLPWLEKLARQSGHANVDICDMLQNVSLTVINYKVFFFYNLACLDGQRVTNTHHHNERFTATLNESMKLIFVNINVNDQVRHMKRTARLRNYTEPDSSWLPDDIKPNTRNRKQRFVNSYTYMQQWAKHFLQMRSVF